MYGAMSDVDVDDDAPAAFGNNQSALAHAHAHALSIISSTRVPPVEEATSLSSR